MLGLYLYTHIIPVIGHKSCNMLSILDKLILQKKLQNFVTNNEFWDKQVKTQQQQNKKNKQRALGRSPEKKVKGHSGAIYRGPLV